MLLNKSNYEKIIFSMDLVKASPKVKWLDNYMIYSILSSKDFKDFALGYKSGTTVLHLKKECFNEYKVSLPENIEIIVKYDNLIKNNLEIIANKINENNNLEKLRDTLLPKLMNGKIDLDKIEI